MAAARVRKVTSLSYHRPMLARVLGVILGVVLVSLVSWGTSAQAEEPDVAQELASIIQKALDNPLSTAAHERTRAAIALEEQVAGHRWTTMEATSFLAPSPRVRCENVDCTQTSPNDVSINIAGAFVGLNLSLTQPLYTGGKLHYAKKAAKSAREASSALEEDVSGDVAIFAAKAYYGYLLAQELIWMLEEGAEHIESGRKTLEEKLEEGSPDATVQDRFRIAALQAEVGARIADAHHGKEVALASIRALVGDKNTSLKGGLLEAIDFVVPSDAASAFVNPQLRAARHALDANAALATYERRGFLPDLALVGGVNVAKAQGVDDPPGAFARDPYNTRSAYVAIVAKWKINPWIAAARSRRQQAKQREAKAMVEAADRYSTLSRSNAFAAAKLAKTRLQALKQGERAGRAWVASVLQADAIGAASAKDLADAYLAYFAARGHVLESTHQWNLAVLELRRQAGEFAGTP